MDIQQVAHSSLTEYLRDRICTLADGTGNLLKVGKRVFIVTCWHVARPFFAANIRYIVLRGNIRISSDHLKLIAQFDDPLDLALIEVEGDCPARGFYTLDDLEFVDNFANHDFTNTNVIVCGFPCELARTDSKGDVHHVWMSYLTLPHRTKSHDSDFLYCEYPSNKLQRENKTRRPVKLPEPHGISGAFILKVPQFEEAKHAIWTSGIAKVIAVQQEGLKHQYIKGTNVKHLLPLLKQAGTA